MNLGIFFAINRVRVSNPQRLTYTQISVEYPPPGSAIVGCFHGLRSKWWLYGTQAVAKRFRSSYCAEVGKRAKRGLKREVEGNRGNAFPQTLRFYKILVSSFLLHLLPFVPLFRERSLCRQRFPRIPIEICCRGFSLSSPT